MIKNSILQRECLLDLLVAYLTARSRAASRPSRPSTLCVSSCTLLAAAAARSACSHQGAISRRASCGYSSPRRAKHQAQVTLPAW